MSRPEKTYLALYLCRELSSTYNPGEITRTKDPFMKVPLPILPSRLAKQVGKSLNQGQSNLFIRADWTGRVLKSSLTLEI